MILITKENVIDDHMKLVRRYGGSSEIRDERIIDMAVNNIYQTFMREELYPTVYDKASILCLDLIIGHPFVDGNKRVGVLEMLKVLGCNNVILNVTNEEVIEFGLSVAKGEYSKDDIKQWILEHVAKYA